MAGLVPVAGSSIWVAARGGTRGECRQTRTTGASLWWAWICPSRLSTSHAARPPPGPGQGTPTGPRSSRWGTPAGPHNCSDRGRGGVDLRCTPPDGSCRSGAAAGRCHPRPRRRAALSDLRPSICSALGSGPGPGALRPPRLPDRGGPADGRERGSPGRGDPGVGDRHAGDDDQAPQMTAGSSSRTMIRRRSARYVGQSRDSAGRPSAANRDHSRCIIEENRESRSGESAGRVPKR